MDRIPLYAIVAMLEARAAQYRMHADECSDLAKRLLRQQGQPNAQEDTADDITDALAMFIARMKVEAPL